MQIAHPAASKLVVEAAEQSQKAPMVGSEGHIEHDCVRINKVLAGKSHNQW
jgi:hypothetical protein